MIDWKQRAENLGSAEVVIGGKSVVARVVSAWVMNRIAAAHPAPGVPFDGTAYNDQDPKYRGLRENHARERAVLEVAAMLGYVHAVPANGEQPERSVDIRAAATAADAKIWVAGVLDVFVKGISDAECERVLKTAEVAGKAMGDLAKKPCASTTPPTP